MSNYNIPESILKKIQRISQMEDSQFEGFLASMELEAETFLIISISSYNDLKIEEKELLISLYIQYTMFSKLENDDIARDKMDTLQSLITTINSKVNKPASSGQVIFI